MLAVRNGCWVICYSRPIVQFVRFLSGRPYVTGYPHSFAFIFEGIGEFALRRFPTKPIDVCLNVFQAV
jgi:hypothetical protein